MKNKTLAGCSRLNYVSNAHSSRILVHEAVARVGSQQYREGIIIEEIRRGFLLKNKVLRQAVVKVSSGPGYKTPSTEEAIGKPAAAVKSIESQNSDSDST